MLRVEDRDELFKVAVHEAGHAVVASLHGVRLDVSETLATRRVSIEGPGGAHVLGYCRYEPFNVATGQSAHVIAAAGPAAEAVVRFGPQPTSEQLASVLHGPDNDSLRRAALTASVGRPVDAVREVLPLVLRVWPAIVGLGGQIDQRAVTDADVCTALGISAAPGQRAFEVANIRAGLRGVPDPREVWAW